MKINEQRENKYLRVCLGIAMIFTIMYGGGVGGAKTLTTIAAFCPAIFFSYFGAKYYLFDNSKQKNEKLLLKKLLLLLVIYGLANLLDMAVYSFKVIFIYENKTIAPLLDKFIDTISLCGNAYSGFLISFSLGGLIYILFRKKISRNGMLIISAFFMGFLLYACGKLDVIRYDEVYAEKAICNLFIAFFRILQGIVFMSVGEHIQHLLIKYENKKVIVGIVGIFIFIGGIFIASTNKNVMVYNIYYGKWYLFIISVLFIIGGIFMMSRWIGEFVIFDYIGKNAILIYITFFSLGICNLAKYVASISFKYANHYFIRNLTFFVVCIFAEFLLIRIYELLFAKSINCLLINLDKKDNKKEDKEDFRNNKIQNNKNNSGKNGSGKNNTGKSSSGKSSLGKKKTNKKKTNKKK